MSKCISKHGEYSSHDLDGSYYCKLCGVLDEEGLVAELAMLRSCMSKVDVMRIIEPCALVESYVRKSFGNVETIPDFTVRIVWFCYILGGWKAWVSTSLPDGMCYEVTHSAVKRETYLDVYKKFNNIKFLDQD